jgi:hypothetical protein
MNIRYEDHPILTFGDLKYGTLFRTIRNADIVWMKLSDMKSAVLIDAKCLTETDYSDTGHVCVFPLTDPVVRLSQKSALVLEVSADQSPKGKR